MLKRLFKEIARFNESDFKTIKQWVARTTKLAPQPVSQNFDPADFVEPVPTKLIKQTDIGLVISFVALTVVLVVRISPNIFARIFAGRL